MSVLGIYSFPKSGNTWVRSILGALFPNGAQAVPDLHQKRLEDGKEYKGFRFYKHHSGTLLQDWKDEQLNTTHVIHIRRNPLDVFLSYMNFQSDNVNGKALIPYKNVEEILGTDLFNLYFHTFVLTGHVTRLQRVSQDYFTHNLQWIRTAQNNNKVKIKCIRYEDMMMSATDTLGFLTGWLKLQDGQLEDLIEKSQATTARDGKFFWKQKERNHLDFLTPDQVRLFVKYRGEEAAEIGYGPEYFLDDL